MINDIYFTNRVLKAGNNNDLDSPHANLINSHLPITAKY